MAEAPDAKSVVDRFLRRQREMYEGGDLAAVEELLADDVVWHVPGSSPIAGEYRGRDAVMDYFVTRRALAGGSIKITQRQEMHDAEVLVQLADGQAALGGQPAEWRTAGVYRVARGKIAEAWLVPLDQDRFDRVWTAVRKEPFAYIRLVDAGDCDAAGTLRHARLVELLEGALADCLLDRGVELDRPLTLSTLALRVLAAVRAGDELRIEVHVDRLSTRSVHAHYDAFVASRAVAEAWSDHSAGSSTDGANMGPA